MVPTWENAVGELDRRNGMEYVRALGEVQFRKEVVSIVNTLTSSQDKVIQVDSAGSLPSSTWENSSERRVPHIREWTDCALLMLPSSMVEQTPQGVLQAKGVWGNLLHMMLRTALTMALVSVLMYLFYLFAFYIFFPVSISSMDKLMNDAHSTSFPFKSTSFSLGSELDLQQLHV